MNDIYLRTARLLTQVAPSVFVDETFALKGGTAINLFYRDMPRLSVDLDLVFCDYTLSRTEAVAKIDTSIRAMAERLRAQGFTTSTPLTIDSESKLIVRGDDITIKVEVNTVMRGTVNPVRIAALTPHASDVLKADLSCRLHRSRTRTVASLRPLWIVSTHVTCSMYCSCSSTRESRRQFGGHSWCTLRVIIDPYTSYCTPWRQTSSSPITEASRG